MDNDLVKQHKELFGKEPIIIGIYFTDVWERVAASIARNEEYNELQELTRQQKDEYEKGNLLF